MYYSLTCPDNKFYILFKFSLKISNVTITSYDRKPVKSVLIDKQKGVIFDPHKTDTYKYDLAKDNA